MSAIQFDISQAINHLDGRADGLVAQIVLHANNPSEALTELPARDIYHFGPATVARFAEALGVSAPSIGDILRMDPIAANGVLESMGRSTSRALSHLNGLRAAILNEDTPPPEPTFDAPRFAALLSARELGGDELFNNAWLRSSEPTKFEDATILAIDGFNTRTAVAFGADMKLLEFAKLNNSDFDAGIERFKALPMFRNVPPERLEAIVDPIRQARAQLRASTQNTPAYREAKLIESAVAPDGTHTNAEPIQTETLDGPARAAVEKAKARIANRTLPDTDYEAKYESVYRIVDPENDGALIGYAVRGTGSTMEGRSFEDAMVYTMAPDGRPLVESYAVLRDGEA